MKYKPGDTAVSPSTGKTMQLNGVGEWVPFDQEATAPAEGIPADPLKEAAQGAVSGAQATGRGMVSPIDYTPIGMAGRAALAVGDAMGVPAVETPSTMAGWAGHVIGSMAATGGAGLFKQGAISNTRNAVFDKIKGLMGGKTSPDKAQVIANAEAAGLKAPLSYTSNNPVIKGANEALKSDTLGQAVGNIAGRANANAFNQTAAEAIGLPKGREVTTQSLQEARKATGEGYKAIEKALVAPDMGDEVLSAVMKPGDFVGGDKAAKLVSQHLETISKSANPGQTIMRARSVFNNESSKAAVKGDIAKSDYFDAAEDALMEASAKAAGGDVAKTLDKLNSQWAAIRLLKKPGALGPDGRVSSKAVKNWARGEPNTKTPIGRLTNQANLLHDMGATVGDSGTASRLGGIVTTPILGGIGIGAGSNLFE